MSEKTTLPDGRTAKKDKNGRWREAETGEFISGPDTPKEKLPDQVRLNLDQRKKTFCEFVLQAVQDKGHQVATHQEALGKIIAVQTQIALDPENGTKATSAARFIIQATGFLDDSDPDDQPETERFLLGKELAGELLQIIEEEKDSRE